jgi:hypothetical protein
VKIDPARVPQYTSAADMVANYRAIHGAFWRQPAPEIDVRQTVVATVNAPAPSRRRHQPPAPPEPKAEIDPEDARMLMVAETCRRPPWAASLLDIIVAAVCQEFQIGKRDLFARFRCPRIVTPRFVLFALARHLTPLSLKQIGYRGGFDHTTVLNGINKLRPVLDAVKDGMPQDASPAEWVRVMREHMGV